MMTFRKLISLPSILAAALTANGLPVLTSTGAAALAVLTFSAAAPSAQAITKHKGGGGGGKGKSGGGKSHAAPKSHSGGGSHRGSHASPHVSHPSHNAVRHSGQRSGGRGMAQGGSSRRGPRHGYRGLPTGAVPYYYDGYNYYRRGSLFFYPYFYGGRTIYIDVDADNGVPLPPPPSGSIQVNF